MKISIYARVSTERQERQETVQSQLESLRKYANTNNYAIYNEYIDNGYSGELLERPALDKLRDDAKNKLFEAVLIASPDRLSRNYIYQGVVQEELAKNRIKIIFLNRPESKDTPEEHLLNGIQGLISQYEKAKILERTRRGKLHKARNGKLVTSVAPYGYKYISSDKNSEGHYEIVREESQVVLLIFDLFANKGFSIRGIAKELTERGIFPRKGKNWRTSTLHRIIKNETYAGTTYFNKHIGVESESGNGKKYRRTKKTSLQVRPNEQWIPIKLPPSLKIIDEKTFKKAQSQLKKNSDLSPRNVKYDYLLRGLLVCGNCLSPFGGECSHGKLDSVVTIFGAIALRN